MKVKILPIKILTNQNFDFCILHFELTKRLQNILINPQNTIFLVSFSEYL